MTWKKKEYWDSAQGRMEENKQVVPAPSKGQEQEDYGGAEK